MDQKSKRPSKSDRTRAAILDAARDLFAGHGYERTTVRDIAARAAIDPALVIRYFGSKDDLFARVAVIDLQLPDLSQVNRANVGETLVLHFLKIWEGRDGNGNGGLTVMLRSAASNEFAAGRLREVFMGQVLPALAKVADPPDMKTRAGLISSQLLGLALGRYILKFPPVVALSQGQIISEVGRTIQRYATGED